MDEFFVFLLVVVLFLLIVTGAAMGMAMPL
jgi:hypothetical protein